MSARTSTIIAALAAALVLDACGGSSGSSPVPATAIPPAAGSITQAFQVTVPSTQTGSIAIAVQSVNGSASTTNLRTVAKLGAGAPGCAASSSSSTGLACTVSAAATVGVDVFSVSTFASNDGSGTALASTTIAATIASSGGANAIPLTLGGVPAKVGFSPTFLPLVNDGAIHRFPIAINALDASGATIIGAAPYASAVSLQILNDPTHALSLSTASVTQSGTVVTVTFDGSKSLSEATIQASATSVPTATLAAAPLNVTPLPIILYDDQTGGATETISEAGFTGAFTASIANAQDASVSVAPGSLQTGSAVASIIPKTTFDITTLNVGNGIFSYGVPVAIVPQVANYATATATRLWLDAGNMVQGPDGKLWVCDGNLGTITSFDSSSGATNTTTLTGVQTSLQTAGLPPMSIAFDTNGNLWFTDVNAIGEFVPSTGAQTLYTAGLQSNAAVSTIIAGPNGKMWFFDQEMNGRLHTATQPTYFGSIDTTTGAITEYPTNDKADENLTIIAMSMVLGADGGIWFADGTNEKLGRIDPSSGAIAEYSTDLPNPPNQAPLQLVNGPDGNIWFTATNQNTLIPQTLPTTSIGSFSPSTKQLIGETALTNATPITSLTVGSDRNLWFTQGQAQPALGVVNPTSHAYFYYPNTLSANSTIVTTIDRGDRTLWMLDSAYGAIGKVVVK
jgi:streptogramin lyase